MDGDLLSFLVALSAVALRVVGFFRFIFSARFAEVEQSVGQVVELAGPELAAALRCTLWT